ncbi:MAG: hypothetical protein AAF586_00035 [Planctomycetota bacterium]
MPGLREIINPSCVDPPNGRGYDLGWMTGRYLQALAGISLVGCIIGMFVSRSFMLDCNIVLYLWAAHYLIKHHPAARMATLIFSGVVLTVVLAGSGFVLIVGKEGMAITAGRRIENPPIWAVFATLFGIGLLAGFPFVMLLTPKARREFTRRPADHPAVSPG